MSQDSLFSLEAVTVQSNEERIRAQQVASGNTVEGRRKNFEASTIKRITLAYGLKDARAVAAWFKAVMKQSKAKNPSEAVLKLKELWEKKYGTTS